MIKATPQNALEIGKAAEYLVCADLILQGYRAFPSDQGLPYDVVIDKDGKLIRLQVKASSKPVNLNCAGRTKRLGYSFHIRRRGKHKTGRLENGSCDLVAMVALDIRTIAYLPLCEVSQCVQLLCDLDDDIVRPRWGLQTKIQDLPFERALQRWEGEDGSIPFKDLGKVELNGERKTIADWARSYGRRPSLVINRLKLGWPLEEALQLGPLETWSKIPRAERLL